MATNGIGCLIGREVCGRVGATLREWYTHSLSKAVKWGETRLALGPSFDHPQPRIDGGCPVETGVGEGRGQVKGPRVALWWKRVFIRFRRCRERCRIREANTPGFDLRGDRWQRNGGMHRRGEGD